MIVGADVEQIGSLLPTSNDRLSVDWMLRLLSSASDDRETDYDVLHKALSFCFNCMINYN